MEAEFRQLEGEWKRIQKKTFTRWCNERLKVQGMQIDDLATDLTDGVKLIVLLELLSQKPFGKYNKKARIHAQRMENIDMALDFITRKEKVRLVNIGEFVQTMGLIRTCSHASSQCRQRGYRLGQLEIDPGPHLDPHLKVPDKRWVCHQ